MSGAVFKTSVRPARLNMLAYYLSDLHTYEVCEDATRQVHPRV